MPSITFTTNPPGAAAILHDKLVGITPVTAQIPEGEIEVTFWKGGYEIVRHKAIISGTGTVGVNLSEDDTVPAPSLPAAQPGQLAQPTQSSSGAGKWIVGVLALGAAGAGGWWLWRRYRRRRGSNFHGSRPKPPGNGATKIHGLGSAAVTCTPGQAGDDYTIRTCITRPERPGPVISSPGAVCKLLRAAKDADRESFFTIALGPQLNVLGVEESAKGQVAGVEVHPREVFKSAVVVGASAIVVAHNHPSGDPNPSQEDKALTKRLVKAGKLVGIPVMDHIVVGDHCVSLSEKWPELFENNEEY